MEEPEQIKEYINSALRTLAPAVAIYLASKGILTESVALNFLLAVTPLVGMVVWGIGNKYVWKWKIRREKQKTDIALQMPQGSTKQDLRAVMQQVSPEP